MEKTISQIQKDVDDWTKQFEKPYFSPLSMVATMTEECGEVARVMNYLYGDKKKKDGETIDNLEDELADLLFTIICIANDQGISLSDAHERKINKLYTRDNNRFKKNNYKGK